MFFFYYDNAIIICSLKIKLIRIPLAPQIASKYRDNHSKYGDNHFNIENETWLTDSYTDDELFSILLTIPSTVTSLGLDGRLGDRHYSKAAGILRAIPAQITVLSLAANNLLNYLLIG